MGEVIRSYLIRKDVNVSKCSAEVRRLIRPASYRWYQHCCCMRTRQIPPRAAELISELIWELSSAWRPDRLRLVPDVNNEWDRVQVPDSETQKRDFPIPLRRFQRGSLNARAVCRGQLAHTDTSALTMRCACVHCMFTYVVCNSRIVFSEGLMKRVLHGQWWRMKLFLKETCGRKQREIGLRMSVIFPLAS